MSNHDLVAMLCHEQQLISFSHYNDSAELIEALRQGVLRLLFRHISAGTEIYVQLCADNDPVDLSSTELLQIKGQAVIDYVPLSCSLQLQPSLLAGSVIFTRA